MFKIIFVLIILLWAVPGSSVADMDWCGFPDDRFELDPFEYTNEINAKIIYVSFPGDEVSGTLEDNKHGRLLAEMESWLTSHSHGELIFSQDSDYLLKRGQHFGAESAPYAWEAKKPAAFYPAAFSDDDYRSEMGDVQFWWDESPTIYETTMSVLTSEILSEIYYEYQMHSSEWPFGNHLENPGQVVDLLIFVFLTNDDLFGEPGRKVGGTIGVPINTNQMFSFQNNMGFEFFGSITTLSDGLQGTVQLKNSSDYDGQSSNSAFLLENATMVCLHEFMHTLGFGEGPPSLTSAIGVERYYSGNLNVSNQRFMPGSGVPIMGLHNLAEMGWVEVVDFTGKNLHAETLYDIRLNSDEQDENGKAKRGQIYKFTRDFPDGTSQSFLMAYHSGIGPDSNLPSKGLEVQHVFDEGLETHFVDLESAFGLFTEISSRVMPQVDLPPEVEPSGWGVLLSNDPTSTNNVYNTIGFDNYDFWEVQSGPDVGNRRELMQNDDDCCWGDFNTHTGNLYDFFSIVDPPDPLGSWIAPEFSFSTNPHCYWYDPDSNPESSSRWKVQSVPNSMIVRIRQQDNNAQFPSMVLDFLSAPYEEIELFDNGGEYQVGEEIVFSLTQVKTEWSQHITGLTAFFCPNASGQQLYEILDLEYDEGGDSYSFEVQPEYGTDPGGGQLVIKFDNDLGDFLGESRSELVAVNSLPVLDEDLLSPLPGDHLFVGSTLRVQWSSQFSSDLYSAIDIQYFKDGQQVHSQTVSHFGFDWFYDNSTERYWTELTLEEITKGENGAFQLTFHDHYGQTFNGDVVIGFRVLPALPTFNDISETALADASYQGSPSSIAPINIDGQKGVVLSLPPGFGQYKGTVLKYSSLPDGDRFEPISDDLFSGLPFIAGSSGIAVADYDGDGDDDFFVCNSGTDPSDESVLFKGSGDGTFSGVSIGAAELTNGAECAYWVDYNHDGYLDLYIGRNGSNSAAPLKNSLFRFDPKTDNFVWETDNEGLYDPRGNHRTFAALWTDWDKDGYWNVVVGDNANNGQSQVFSQGPDGFELSIQSNPFESLKPTSFCMQGFDQAEGFDLIIGQQTQISLFRNLNSFPSISEEIFPYQEEVHQISSGDADGDGALDLVITSGTNAGFDLLLNLSQDPSFNEAFVEIGSSIGFPSSGEAKGAVQVDLDGDGDLDLFSGMAEGHLGNAIWENSSNPDNWVGIQLLSASGATPYGAEVSLFNEDQLLGSQYLGLAMGQSSQGPNDIVFTVPSSLQSCSLRVVWPNSGEFVQTIPVDERYHPISEPSLWDYSSDPTFKITFHELRIDWIFSWETDSWTPGQEDWVEYTPAQGCSVAAGILVPGEGTGVSGIMTYQRDAQGNTKFFHQIVWQDAPCLPGCSQLQFTVHSGGGSVVEKQSGPHVGRLPRLCPVVSGE